MTDQMTRQTEGRPDQMTGLLLVTTRQTRETLTPSEMLPTCGPGLLLANISVSASDRLVRSYLLTSEITTLVAFYSEGTFVVVGTFVGKGTLYIPLCIYVFTTHFLGSDDLM
jgi:hypothetical protein